MNLTEKLDKIKSEFKNGLRFKATNKLRNLIQENPNEIELWNELAKLYYESGFLDAAGKYWILTEQIDERIKKCVEIYEKSVNYSGYQILQEITFRGDKSKLPEYAKQKMSELESDSEKKVNYIPKFSPKLNIQKKKKLEQKQTIQVKLVGFIFILIVIILVILMIVGFITLKQWLF